MATSTHNKNTKQEKVKPKRSRGRPRPEDVAIIESKLVQVALNEFLEHGYGGTSMARIVKVAGISKTTLYSRFSSKEQLFRAIVRQQIDNSAPATFLKSDSGLEQGLKSYANQMIKLNLEGDLLGVNRLIYSESQRFHELGAAAAERTALGVRRISQFIQDCAKSSGANCKDPDIAAEVFILMLRGWFVNVLLTNRDVSVVEREEWVERAVNVLLADQKHW
ncbi:MAG: TetR/AcrR family transcriptional regulator [Spongiibacteraceae bacterium]